MRPKLLYKNSLAVAATALAFLLAATSAFAQTSGFTYQGRLTDGGAAANGNYDLQFAVFDSLSGGTQIGSTQTLNTVAVSNGVFSVALDFGANSFPGANRFLEISARPSGGGSFTLLTPRQQVTSTPYAVRSASAGNADTATNATNATTATNATHLGGIAGSQYVQTSDSRLTDSRPPTPGSASYIQNSTNAQSNTNFNISGNGTAGGALSGNSIGATTQFNLNGVRVLSEPNGGCGPNLFVGDFAGQLNTTGCINSFFGLQAGGDNKTGADNNFFGRGAGLRNVSGGSNAYFGSLAGAASTTGGFNSYFGVAAGLSALGSENTFVGNHADFSTSNASGDKNTLLGASTMVSSGLSNATAIGACAVVTQNNSLILGSISSGTRVCLPQPDTNVGIGTPAPQARLHIVDGGGNILFTNAGCGQGFAGIMFASSVTANCQGYAILGGTDNNTYINRPAGGTIHFREANVTQLSIRPGGVVTIASLGTASNPQATLCRNTSNEIAFCNSSSLRYKNNVATFAGGMNIINRLRPILFTWKQDGTKDIGFGAEEVEKVAPLFTFRNDKGEIEGVRYDRLGVLFVNAFKEQQTKIERQQKEIGELKKLVCRSHARAAVCK